MDTQSFRETVRTVTVSYPIPFMFAVSLAVSLFCLAGAALFVGHLSWLFASIGIVGILNSFVLCWYAVIRKPKLLRSEKHSVINRLLNIMSDDEGDPSVRNQAGKMIYRMVADPDSKMLSVNKEHLPTDEDHNGT